VQNLYDNEAFHTKYKQLRDTQSGLNEVLEQPAIKSLLPSLKGLSVLDIGCGFGDFCRFAASSGATHIIGVDPSHMMLAEAKEKSGPLEQYRVGTFETLALQERFDLVVSSLAIHYVKDIQRAFSNVASVLKKGGSFVFSMEHPLITCGQGKEGGWVAADDGQRKAWVMGSYSDEGERVSHWFIEGVVKYHRRVSTIMNHLLDAGFRIDAVLEPYATEQAQSIRPDLIEERIRPSFMIIRARL